MAAVKKAAGLPAPSGASMPARPLMQQAREAGVELGLAVETLNERLARAESVLGSLRMGVSAHVDLTTEDEAMHDSYREMCFRKEGADWRIMVCTGSVHEGARFEEGATPVLKTPKHIRIMVAHRIDALLKAMIKEAQRQFVEIFDAGQAIEVAIAEPVPVVRVVPPAASQGNDGAEQFDDEIPF